MKIGTTIDYFVLAIYFLILVAIGFYFAKKMKGGHDFFSGGNKIPWWVSGISLYMSNFSAWTFTGAAGFVYFTGWYGVLYFCTWSFSFLIGSQLTAAKWRRSRVISPVEYTSTRYNKTTQQVIGYVILLNMLFSLGIGLAAVSKVIAAAMGIDITLVVLVAGIAILLYTFLGGLWAVTIADVIQFVILIAISLIILPLSLNLVGGIGEFITKSDTLSLSHVYKGEKFDIFYLISVILINIINGAYTGQRYYSVKDEKDAKKVGITCGLLFLTVPILFGIPPMVARIIWPDLSLVPFFQNQLVPNESIFIGIVLKVLPNGLIGIFMAAMFSATLSSIDSAYNMTASIIAKDLYANIFNPKANDKQIMFAGRIATFVIGIITIVTAYIYATSQLGFFYWGVTFVSLFFLPMTMPLVFGLLFENLPRWAGLATILIGLLVSITTRFLLGYSFGWQVISIMIVCTMFLLTSDFLRRIYLNNKFKALLFSFLLTFLISFIFYIFSFKILNNIEKLLLMIIFFLFSIGVYYFSHLFAKETIEDKTIIKQFFEKLNTPVDVIKEVYSKGIVEVSSFPFVGKIVIIIGCLIAFLAFFDMKFNEILITLFLSLILIVIGLLMVYFGGRSERQYRLKMEEELSKLKVEETI
mgnify:CR=1 FL=1|jgi:SSS family transporter